MAGLVPAIHVFADAAKEDVDARHNAGHGDGINGQQKTRPAQPGALLFAAAALRRVTTLRT
jgi:hypothetical protein